MKKPILKTVSSTMQESEKVKKVKGESRHCNYTN